MTPDDPRHGTQAGHSQHRRDGEEPCSACRKAKSAATYERTFGSDDVELVGGRWVPNPATGGLTSTWQADTDIQADTPTREVACKCGALAYETCRTKNGERTRSHIYRTKPRTCRLCDAPPKPRSTYCAPCRAALIREQHEMSRRKTMTRNPVGAPHLSLVAGTMDSEGTAQKSTPERRANASARGPRQPVMKGLTDSCTA